MKEIAQGCCASWEMSGNGKDIISHTRNFASQTFYLQNWAQEAKDKGRECLICVCICICKKNQGLSETVVKDVQDARRVFLTELRTLRNVRRGRKRRTTDAKERTLRVVTIFRDVMMKKAELQEREEGGRLTNRFEIWLGMMLFVIGL